MNAILFPPLGLRTFLHAETGHGVSVSVQTLRECWLLRPREVSLIAGQLLAPLFCHTQKQRAVMILECDLVVG